MTVWIINPFDNLPMEGNRPQRYWLMARAFVGAGHRVVLWTSDFSHAAKRRRSLVAENPDPAIEVRMVPTKPYPRNICLRRVFSHRALAREWRRLAEAACREGRASARPELVIASTPPLSLCAAALDFAHANGARFIADIMDAWPETFYRVAPAWLLSPLRATARRIYRSADAVSAVAARYLDLAASYGATAPTRLAYHGIDLQPSNVQPFNLSTFQPFHLAYLGAMSTSYDLETAIDAVLAMPDVSLDLAGSGPKEAALRTRAASCPRIRFHGYLGDAEVRALLAKCDVGLVPMFPASCVGVPYKLADYAAAGLKVVECLGGETAALVNRHGAGTHYEAGNVESLREAIEAVRDLGAGNPNAFAAEFDATKIMGGYVEWACGLL